MTRRGEAIGWLTRAVNYREDGCLAWPFYRAPNGYGMLNYGGVTTTAHRLLCMFVNGEPPAAERIEAAHSCGNRACCNPTHIRWATCAENTDDKRGHGTMPLGEKATWSRLKEPDVVAIRRDPRMGVELAAVYGVSKSTVYDIRKHKTWRHV